MDSKQVVTGAAVVVLLAVLGVMVIVGVILLMMWKQPGIAHSPSEESNLFAPRAAVVSLLDPTILRERGGIHCRSISRSEA